MPEVQGIDKLLSVLPKKRFGLFNQFGTSQFGFSVYGEEDIFLYFTQYGESRFGVDPYANILLLSGIYRTDNVTGKTKYYREPFYITKNPRYAPQQAWRGIFADAVLAWQGLTTPEKAVYNIKAKGKRMSGYNLFLKEYLESH
jgi:hypothetical protein